MLPVRVKVLSSSSCTLSQASTLLQRFLSGHACSDSLARDYVANVAQALQDSISRRAEESGGTRKKHRNFSSSSSQLSSPSRNELADGTQSILAKERATPYPARSKLHGREKQKSFYGEQNNGKPSVIAAGDDGEAAMGEAENAHKRHKKKRRNSALENGTETVFAASQEAEDSVMYHDKKRRKKEKTERETEQVVTGLFTPDNQERKKKEKSQRHTEHIGSETATPDSQKRRKKEKIIRGGEHITAENVSPDSKKHHEKKKRKDNLEVETNIIETARPMLDDKQSHEKKKRKKEKQGKYAVNLETLHVKEFGSPPTFTLVSESLDAKSAAKGKKKRDVGVIDANRILESGVSDTPLLIVNEEAGSLKRKKKEGKLATPDKLTRKNATEKTDVEALRVELRSFDSEEKKRKKKRKRKEEPEAE